MYAVLAESAAEARQMVEQVRKMRLLKPQGLPKRLQEARKASSAAYSA
jgi:hypothetical protein